MRRLLPLSRPLKQAGRHPLRLDLGFLIFLLGGLQFPLSALSAEPKARGQGLAQSQSEVLKSHTGQNYFDQRREFPNYFLPPEYRGPGAPPLLQSYKEEIKGLLGEAVRSLLSRMVVPVIPDGATGPKQVRYYAYLGAELQKIDSSVELLPVGGTVRGCLSEIYREIFETLQSDPNKTVQAVLREIASRKTDIPAGNILGPGSDMDSLFLNGYRERVPELEKRASEITNSVISTYGKDSSESMRRVFFIRGDIKEYQEQMTRSLGGGGSELDHLAFSMKSGQFVEPPQGHAPGTIVSDFIEGHYRYLPASHPQGVEDRAKVVVRGPRAMTEIPFLSIHPSDSAFYQSELRAVELQLKQGVPLSPKALEQFDKLVRSSRFSGGHNRLHRSAPGSIEAQFLAFSKQVEKKWLGKKTLLPEFVDSFSLAHGRRPLNGLPEKLLMKPERFLTQYTDHGVVYHGTAAENGIGILRGGLYVSTAQGEHAHYGRGVYTTPDLATVSQYSANDGLVLGLKFDPKTVANLNVLDLSDPAVTAQLQGLQLKAQREGRDFHELLAREHGIDVIVNRHVLIQNAAPLEMPKDPKLLLDSYFHQFNSSGLSLETRLKAGGVYEELSKYSHALGTDLPPLNWSPLLKEALASPEESVQEEAMHAVAKAKLRDVSISSGMTRDLQMKLGAPASKRIQKTALKVSYALDPGAEVLHRALLQAMTDPELGPEAAKLLGIRFETLRKTQPFLLDQVLSKLKTADSGFSDSFLIALRGTPDSPELGKVFQTFLSALPRGPDGNGGQSDAQFYHRRQAAQLLAEKGRRLESENARLVGQLLSDTDSEVRATAAEALMNVQFAETKQWMLPLLSSRLNPSVEMDSRVRSRVAQALGRAGQWAEFQALLDQGLYDPSENVRRATLESLQGCAECWPGEAEAQTRLKKNLSRLKGEGGSDLRALIRDLEKKITAQAKKKTANNNPAKNSPELNVPCTELFGKF